MSGRSLLVSLAILVLAPLAAGAQPAPDVPTDVLGIGVGSPLDLAEERLGALGNMEGRSTREGGRKVVWRFRGTAYAWMALKSDASGQVVWMTVAFRPGREPAYAELGDLDRSLARTPELVVWETDTPAGGLRALARGRDGRVTALTLLAISQGPPGTR